MKVKIDGLEDFKKYINTSFPEQVDRAMQQAAEGIAQDLRIELASAVGKFDGNVGWTGYLYNSIRAYNSAVHGWGTGNKPDQWGVTMLPYGKELDARPPHTEWLTKGRKITTWAKAHNIKAKELVVRPHPFIQQGLSGAKNRIQTAKNQIGD